MLMQINIYSKLSFIRGRIIRFAANPWSSWTGSESIRNVKKFYFFILFFISNNFYLNICIVKGSLFEV